MKKVTQKVRRSTALPLIMVVVTAIVVGIAVAGNVWADTRHSVIATEDLVNDSQWLNYFEYEIVSAPSDGKNGQILITHCKQTFEDDTEGYNPPALTNGALTVKGTVKTASTVSHGDADSTARYESAQTYDITMKAASGNDSVFKDAPETVAYLTIASDVTMPESMGSFFQFAENLKSITIDSLANANKVNSMTNMFYRCTSLKKVTLTNGAFTKCDNLDYMFSMCSKLEEIDFKGTDFSGVSRADLMFRGCTALRKFTTPAEISKGSKEGKTFGIGTTFSGRDITKEDTTAGDEVVFFEERTADDVDTVSGSSAGDGLDDYNAQANLLKGAPFKTFNANMHPNKTYYRGIAVVFMTMNTGLSAYASSYNDYRGQNETQVYKIYALKYGAHFYAGYLKQPSYYYPWGFTNGVSNDAVNTIEMHEAITTQLTNVYNYYAKYYANWCDSKETYSDSTLYKSYQTETLDGKFKLTTADRTETQKPDDGEVAVPFLQDDQGFPVNQKFKFIEWDTKTIDKQYSTSDYSYNTVDSSSFLENSTDRKLYSQDTKILENVTSTVKIRPKWAKKSYQVIYHNNIPGSADKTEEETWTYTKQKNVKQDKNYKAFDTVTSFVNKSDFAQIGYHIKNWIMNPGDDQQYVFWNYSSKNNSNTCKFDSVSSYWSYDQWYYMDLDDNGQNTYDAQSVKELNVKDTKYEVDGNLDGTVDLYANWEKTNYTIIYVGKNGTKTTSTCVTDGKKAQIDESYTVKSITDCQNSVSSSSDNPFKKGGLNFVGWSTTDPTKDTSEEKTYIQPGALKVNAEMVKNAERTNQALGQYSSTEYKNVIYLYAVFNNNYTIEFNANADGDNVKGAMTDQAAKVDEATVLSKCTLDRPGYTFTGWSTTEDGKVVYSDAASIKYTTDQISKLTTTKVTLYAQWTPNEWSFTYDYNYKGSAEATTEKYKYDVDGTTKAPAIPAEQNRTGYVFKYWSSNKDEAEICDHTDRDKNTGKCSNAEDAIHVLPNTIVTKLTEYRNNTNTTLYAVWEPVKYTVTLMPQIPEGSDVVVKGDVSASFTQQLTYAKEEALPSVSGLLEEQNGTALKELSITDGAGKTYTTYQTSDGTYVFMGWTSAPANPSFSGGKVSDGSEVFTDAQKCAYNLSTQNGANVTLYGHWIKSNKITYKGLENAVFANGEDSTTEDNPNPAAFNCLMGKFTLSNPTRYGYEFAGWQWEYNGETQISKSAVVDTDAMVGLTYTATWKATPFTITYDYNSSTPDKVSVAASQPDHYTVDQDTNIYSPTQSGYKFTGWTISGVKDAKENAKDDITVTTEDLTEGHYNQPREIYGNLTYTANWEYQEFHVGYIATDASGQEIARYYPEDEDNSSDIVKGITLKKLEDINKATGDKFTRTGYHLKQWYAEYDKSDEGLTTKACLDGANVTLKEEEAEALLGDDRILWLQTEWEANTNTKYMVDIYFQNSLTMFDSTPDVSIEYAGTSDQLVTVNPLYDPKITEAVMQKSLDDQTSYSYSGDDYELFGTKPNVTKSSVTPDGTLHLKLYYLRSITVTYEPGEHAASDQEAQKELVPVGTVPTAKNISFRPADGYQMKEWSFTKPVYVDTTFKAEYTPITYQINYNMNNSNFAHKF